LPVYLTSTEVLTAAVAPHSIGYVPVRDRGRCPLPQLALTKRRAVDFCRVSTAICPAARLRGLWS
jgi:hypothetical protein